jgi:hypothetical protein
LDEMQARHFQVLLYAVKSKIAGSGTALELFNKPTHIHSYISRVLCNTEWLASASTPKHPYIVGSGTALEPRNTCTHFTRFPHAWDELQAVYFQNLS